MLSQGQGLSFQEFVISWALSTVQCSENYSNVGHGTHVFHKVMGLVALTL